jgi:acylphosphatase
MARAKKMSAVCARRYFVGGRVQGVGFRYFVERIANDLNLTGYARNLSDGRVEVYAAGPPDRLSQLEGHLRMGPRMADVRGVEDIEASVLDYSDFRIEHF